MTEEQIKTSVSLRRNRRKRMKRREEREKAKVAEQTPELATDVDIMKLKDHFDKMYGRQEEADETIK